MPENKPRTDLLVDRKEIELLGQPAMIPPLGLFQPVEMVIEILLRRPGRAVNPLEHRALLTAPPVSAGHIEQLELADLRRVPNVRPAAEIGERILGIAGDHGIFRQIIDDLYLVGLVGKIGQRLFP